MSTEENSKAKITEDNSGTGINKSTQLIGIIAMVVVVIIISALSISKNKNSGNEHALSKIAPASADAGVTPAEAPMVKLGNPTVAVVNGKEIMRSDVFTFISGLPDQVRQMPIQTLFPLALEQVVNNHLIGDKAQVADLETDPEVEQLLTQAKGQIVRNVFVDRKIEEGLTQKRILKAYEKMLSDIGEIEEVKARHILVEGEDKAKEIITKLDAGSDFEELAKENSTGPSAEKGGDLGYFAKSEMVPEFANKAFELKPGSYTSTPVQTQFGWHVIKVEEKRKRPEPQFEAVKPQLEQQLRQEILAELLENWQKDAKIKKFDINGDTVKK